MWKHPVVLSGLIVLVLGGLIDLLVNHGRKSDGGEGELMVFCAAGFQKPMAEAARRYEAETGVRVGLQFGGSGALESQLRVAGGDLFFPADEDYLKSLEEEGFLESVTPVTVLRAGLVVAEGNPKGFAGLDDLAKAGVTISLAEESASIGKFSREVLEAEGMWAGIGANVIVTKPTVTGVVSDVSIGAADVAIAWEVVVRNFPGVEWVSVPEFEVRKKRGAMGILKKGRVEEAERFLRFMVMGEGRRVFEGMGYEVIGRE